MLVLEIAFDVVLMAFVLAFLPLFLGDLLFFADPASGIGFICFTGAFFAVLWMIDHAADENFWRSVGDRRLSVATMSTRNERGFPAPILKFRTG